MQVTDGSQGTNVSIVGNNLPRRQIYIDTLGSILERNLTVVRSVGDLLAIIRHARDIGLYISERKQTCEKLGVKHFQS